MEWVSDALCSTTPNFLAKAKIKYLYIKTRKENNLTIDTSSHAAAVKRLTWDWGGEHLRLTKSDFWYSFFLLFVNSCFYVQKWVFLFLIFLFLTHFD